MTKQEWINKLIEMHGLDEEDILDIAEICIDDCNSNLSILQNAEKEASELKELARIAHSMKGATANLCLEDFAVTASILEEKLQNGDFSDYEKHIEALAQHLNEFKQVVA